jgi:type II secretory pathway component PulF
MNFRIAFIIYWILFFVILFVIVPVATFVIPSHVAEWRAQGLREVPWHGQVLVDFSDFVVHRWLFFFVPYFAVGIWLKWMAKRQNS